MIIDIHAHACGAYSDAPKILAALDEAKIAKVVLCPGEKDSNRSYNFPQFKRDPVYAVNRVISLVTRLSGVAKHIEEMNQFVFSLCQKNPERLLQGYWINPLHQQAVQHLDRDLGTFRFKLIKIHQCWTYCKINTPGFAAIADWAAAHSLPIFIHLKSRRDALDLIEFSATRRATVFIVAHLIGIVEFCKSKDLSENVYFDISCPPLVPLHKVQLALEHFGAARLLFGSDIPYGANNVPLNLARINGLALSQAEKDDILGHNAGRILQIAGETSTGKGGIQCPHETWS